MLVLPSEVPPKDKHPINGSTRLLPISTGMPPSLFAVPRLSCFASLKYQSFYRFSSIGSFLRACIIWHLMDCTNSIFSIYASFLVHSPDKTKFVFDCSTLVSQFCKARRGHNGGGYFATLQCSKGNQLDLVEMSSTRVCFTV